MGTHSPRAIAYPLVPGTPGWSMARRKPRCFDARAVTLDERRSALSGVRRFTHLPAVDCRKNQRFDDLH